MSSQQAPKPALAPAKLSAAKVKECVCLFLQYLCEEEARGS